MKFFSRTSLIACLVAAVIPAFADSTANPLADFENFSETRALVRNAEEALSRENYKAAAKNYRKAAKIQSNEGKRAEFLYLEAQNLLRAGGLPVQQPCQPEACLCVIWCQLDNLLVCLHSLLDLLCLLVFCGECQAVSEGLLDAGLSGHSSTSINTTTARKPQDGTSWT